MSTQSATWFAATAFVGMTFSLMHADSVLAQPPGRGAAGPGRGGPPNVAEMFSRMDRNDDGQLTKDEVPEPVWDRLSHADKNGDGGVTKDEATQARAGRPLDRGRPDGGRPDARRADPDRPDGPPDARSREDQRRDRDARPLMAREGAEASRDQARGPRDAHRERGGPAPPHSPSHPDRDRSGPTDSARRGPSPFAPNAFFDRLDKNRDGSLSREEFQAVAKFHRGMHSTPRRDGFGQPWGPGAHWGPGDHWGPWAHRGRNAHWGRNAHGRPSGPPMAHRGPAPRGGGPPWARDDDRGDSLGPHGFPVGPPWARPGYGPHFNSKVAGPPWAHPADRDQGPRHEAKDRKPRHGDTDRQHPKPHKQKRAHSHRPERGDRTEADAPRAGSELTSEASQSNSPSDESVPSSARAKPVTSAPLPL